MDGSNQIVLANLSNIGQTIVDVVLDKPGNRLFFSDQSNNVIRYIDLSNMEVHTLLSGNLHHPTGLMMLNNTLYWTAQGDGRFSGTIFKAEATNGSTAHMVADGFWNPYGIYAHNSRAPQTPGNAPKMRLILVYCGVKWGGGGRNECQSYIYFFFLPDTLILVQLILCLKWSSMFEKAFECFSIENNKRSFNF